MINDIELAVQEIQFLTEQIHFGRLDVDRWRTCIRFLHKIGWHDFAKSMNKGLAVYRFTEGDSE